MTKEDLIMKLKVKRMNLLAENNYERTPEVLKKERNILQEIERLQDSDDVIIISGGMREISINKEA